MCVYVGQVQEETIYDLGVCRAVKRSYRQNRNFSLWALIRGSMEKETATHSSVLAWRIPGMEEPGGLPSMGLHRVRHG